MITIFHQVNAQLEQVRKVRKTKSRILHRIKVPLIAGRSSSAVEPGNEWAKSFGGDVEVVDPIVEVGELAEPTDLLEEPGVGSDAVLAVEAAIIGAGSDLLVDVDILEPKIDPPVLELVNDSTRAEAPEQSGCDDEPISGEEGLGETVTEPIPANLSLFVDKAVERASRAVGSLIEKQDLFQVAHLAALEAKHDLAKVAPGQRRMFLRDSVTAALKQELKLVAADCRSLTSASSAFASEDDSDQLISMERFLTIDDGGADEVVASAEAATEISDILQTMPDEMARVVRLRFGLEGTAELSTDAIAELLALDAARVADHLRAAGTLFRHSSTEGNYRGSAPIGYREFQTFKWEGDLASYDLREVNLNNVNLEHCDLSNAVLSGGNLWGAKLFRATLNGANLWGSQIDNSDLQQTDLSQANFERASLCGANLRLANASRANFWGADFGGAQLEHANFHQSDLRSANLAGVNLSLTNLTGADLSGADLRGCTMDQAKLAGANLRGADLTDASLQFADLRNADLCWANMSGVDLYGANLNGAARSPALQNIFSSRAPAPRHRRLRSVAG